MGFAPINTYPPSIVTAASDGGAVETVVITSGPVNTDSTQKRVFLWGVVNLTTDAKTSAVVVKVYRGISTAGVLLSTVTQTVDTGGDVFAISFAAQDEPKESHGRKYCVSVTETDAQGDGTISFGVLSILVGQ
jgi:hypothetical protein